MASGPNIAAAAVALRRSHPRAPAMDVLDLVMQGHEGTVIDFSDPTQPRGTWSSPTSDFGAILAAAFDKGMAPEDWRLVDHPNTDPAVVSALMGI